MTDQSDLFAWIVIAPLWTFVFARMPAVLRRGTPKTLWAIFTTLAVSMTIRLDSIHDGLYRLTGIADLSILIKQLIGIGAVYLLTRWLVQVSPYSLRDRPTLKIMRRYHREISLGVLAAECLTFPTARLKMGESDDEFILAQVGSPGGTLYLVIFYVYVSFALVCTVLMSLDAWRQDRHGMLGGGMALVSIGTGIGAWYGVWRTVFLIEASLGIHFPGGPVAMLLFSQLFKTLCIILAILGVVLPFGEILERNLQTRRNLIDLRELWEEVAKAAPDTVYSESPHWFAEHFDLRHVRLRLTHRVADLQDGLRLLRGYIPEGLPEQVQAIVAQLGVRQPALTVRTYLIKEAIRRARAGYLTPSQHPRDLLVGSGDDEDEVFQLVRVARNWKNPVLREVDRRVIGGTSDHG